MSGPTTGLPIFDSARKAVQRAEHDLEHDIERGWGKITGHIHHARPENTPTTKGTTMADTLETTIEADFEKVKTKLAEGVQMVEDFASSKLPAATATINKLAGNPVVDALLSAVHVPVGALTAAVHVIEDLEELYKPDTDTQTPAEPAAAAVATPAAS